MTWKVLGVSSPPSADDCETAFDRPALEAKGKRGAGLRGHPSNGPARRQEPKAQARRKAAEYCRPKVEPQKL